MPGDDEYEIEKGLAASFGPKEYIRVRYKTHSKRGGPRSAPSGGSEVSFEIRHSSDADQRIDEARALCMASNLMRGWAHLSGEGSLATFKFDTLESIGFNYKTSKQKPIGE